MGVVRGAQDLVGDAPALASARPALCRVVRLYACAAAAGQYGSCEGR
ncbi:hypothetical protein [Streptomyces anulatus]|nr:hypothetical protein [Streptomyces anulatus]